MVVSLRAVSSLYTWCDGSVDPLFPQADLEATLYSVRCLQARAYWRLPQCWRSGQSRWVEEVSRGTRNLRICGVLPQRAFLYSEREDGSVYSWHTHHVERTLRHWWVRLVLRQLFVIMLVLRRSLWNGDSAIIIIAILLNFIWYDLVVSLITQNKFKQFIFVIVMIS